MSRYSCNNGRLEVAPSGAAECWVQRNLLFNFFAGYVAVQLQQWTSRSRPIRSRFSRLTVFVIGKDIVSVVVAQGLHCCISFLLTCLPKGEHGGSYHKHSARIRCGAHGQRCGIVLFVEEPHDTENGLNPHV